MNVYDSNQHKINMNHFDSSLYRVYNECIFYKCVLALSMDGSNMYINVLYLLTSCVMYGVGKLLILSDLYSTIF